MAKKANITKQDFARGYAHLLLYAADHEDLIIDTDCVLGDGFKLGEWVNNVRSLWNDGKLKADYVLKLSNIGLSKNESEQAWESMYYYAYDYYRRNGNSNININFRTDDGQLLGAWVDRQMRNISDLSFAQRKKLMKIGIKAGL